VTVIDAGISGGEKGAAAGTLLTMVGGDAVTVERARPILATFSKEVLHAGPRGAGMALKLARNAACYTMMAAFHEAIELAHGSGVDIAELRRVIEETDVFGMAPAPFQIGGPRPLPDDAPAPLRAVLEHTLRLAEKDFEQSVALARRIGADVPVLETAHRTFARVVRL
jgi:3-hydroxyisobutyrate dehydrogenase-like beta-hydroxyacid dehydrogenase